MMQRIKQGRKSRRCLIFIMTVLLMLSAGCGQNKEKEVDTDDKQQEEGNKLAQYSDVGGTVWTESWESESSYYKKIDIQVDALVVVPAVEKMAVAEVKEYTFDKENIQMTAQGIFGSSVSACKAENMPKDVLEKWLKVAEKQLEGAESEKEEAEREPGAFHMETVLENYENCKKEVDNLTKLIESAGDDFVREPAGEYQEKHYAGEWNGKEYLLDFEDEVVIGEEITQERKIVLYPRQEKDFWPEELKEMEEVEKSISSSRSPEKEPDFEKAQKAAEELLKKAGFPDTLCSSSEFLFWDGTPSEGSGQKAKRVQYGYRFTYVTGADGLTFWNPGWWYDDSWSGDVKNEYPAYTKVEIDVTDAGVICAEWTYPIITTSVTSGVQLLPFDDIKNVLRELLGERIDVSYAGYIDTDDKEEMEKIKDQVKTEEIKRLQLGYFRIKDPSREGYYSYVPVWKADDDCIVNAIDGTVIQKKE